MMIIQSARMTGGEVADGEMHLFDAGRVVEKVC